jgi:GT2 family glycosyltransferase
MPANTASEIDISIIVVNYNVKERVETLLHSVKESADYGRLTVETFVVDNHSSDGSVEYLMPLFPEVHFIANTENYGFGKANNQAIKRAKGRYCLLVNPDAVLEPDTLLVMYRFMQQHPDTGAAGCKLLNPDGSFAPESRRSVPTPATAFWKMTGLSTLFPRSRFFGSYHMGWLPENEAAEVPVLSGSFMFYRREVLQEIGGFDERFFMYGEDIDICYRTTKAGYEIRYTPATSVTHHKGASTKKEHLDYHVIFNKAMYQFFEKHYSKNYTAVFRLLVAAALVLKVGLEFLLALLRRSRPLFRDLALGNLILLLTMAIRVPEPLTEVFLNFDYRFLVVNGLFSAAFTLLSVYYDLYHRNKQSYVDTLKAVVLAFSAVVIITFFFRDFAFSRWIILVSTLATAVIMLLHRVVIWAYLRKDEVKTVLLVGYAPHTDTLIEQLNKRRDVQICGLILQHGAPWRDEVAGVPVIGRTEFTARLAAYHKVEQIYFTVPALDMSGVLEQMIGVYDTGISMFIVPPSVNYALGRSRLRMLGSQPVIEKELAFNRKWNRFLKRSLDVVVSLPLLLLLLPVMLPLHILHRRRYSWFSFRGSNDMPFELGQMQPYDSFRNRLLNFGILLWFVLLGRFSLVGAPLFPRKKRKNAAYKQGLTGVEQLFEDEPETGTNASEEELYYLQNYAIWMDLNILLQTIWKRKTTIKPYLEW